MPNEYRTQKLAYDTCRQEVNQGASNIPSQNISNVQKERKLRLIVGPRNIMISRVQDSLSKSIEKYLE